jgi:GGDEF domain-containing protein
MIRIRTKEPAGKPAAARIGCPTGIGPNSAEEVSDKRIDWPSAVLGQAPRDMISLKSYFSREPGNESDYRRIISLFLQGIALHAVEGDPADHERFRVDINKCLTSVAPETPLSDLLVLVGSALRAMEDYNKLTSRFVRRQSTELHHMVSMLTKTIISIGDSSEHSVTRLQDIEKSMESTKAVEDIQLLKMRLGECLEAVRDEAKRQKTEGQIALASLKQELENSHETVGSVRIQRELDASTGLLAKAEADRAIREAMQSPRGKFLLIAVCSRVQAVNARFGYAVGDRVLGTFAEHFKKGLAASDQIFRWQGPSLIAVLERQERIERVRSEIQRFADTKLEKTTEVGQRTVLIPISAAWSIFPIAPPLEALLKQVEAFTTAQAPRDYV